MRFNPVLSAADFGEGERPDDLFYAPEQRHTFSVTAKRKPSIFCWPVYGLNFRSSPLKVVTWAYINPSFAS